MRSCREVAQVPNLEGTERRRSRATSRGLFPRGRAALVTTKITGTRRHRPGRDWQNAAASALPLAVVLVPRAPRLALAAAMMLVAASNGRAGSPRPPREPPAARPMRADPSTASPPGATSGGLSHGAVPWASLAPGVAGPGPQNIIAASCRMAPTSGGTDRGGPPWTVCPISASASPTTMPIMMWKRKDFGASLNAFLKETEGVLYSTMFESTYGQACAFAP